MDSIQKTILICAGGTGGHVMPAISLSEFLNAQNHTVIIMTDDRGVKYLNNIDNVKIIINSFKRSPKLLLPFYFLKNLIHSLIILMRNKPNLVIGFGGYPSFSGVFMAWLLRISTMIHEQNAVLGRANRLLGWIVCKIMVGFKNTQRLHSRWNKKTIFVGNPVRQSILAKQQIVPSSLPTSPFNLLIIGGSQGATIFSTVVPPVLIRLKNHFKIVHQVRNDALDTVKKLYEINHMDVEINTFFNNMDDQLSKADLVIARAGASTLAELNALSKPTILVPYKHAQNNHQYYNAMASNGCWIMDENDFNEKNLENILNEIINDPNCLIEKRNEIVPHVMNWNSVIELLKSH
jgi:UDP-N-acetylglucosamine--N-acetylmuramyl-(pentapeptide) pyrophosphoryl-undecaprenol N-acetylglucosamine transferase